MQKTPEETVEDGDPPALDDFVDAMGLPNDEGIESVVTATVYYWRSNDINDSLAFPATAHIWNAIQTANENGFSTPIRPPTSIDGPNNNSIYSSMGIMNKGGSDITALWQTVTKTEAATVSDNPQLEEDNELDDILASWSAPASDEALFVPTLDVVVNPNCGPDTLYRIKRTLGMLKQSITCLLSGI